MTFPVFINMSLIKFPGLTELLNPAIFPSVLLAVHVQSVPATSEVNVIFVGIPEHCSDVRGLLVIEGIGLTIAIISVLVKLMQLLTRE